MTGCRHRDLPVWKASIDLVEAFYVISAKLPNEETFGPQAQMRRAAVSVAADIAEGAARKSTPELIRFLYVANGSRSELAVIQSLKRRNR